MFGLTFEKLLLIGIIAVFVLGPERLPGYAAKLAQFIRSARDMANGAKARMKDEMGDDFDDVDWKKLDPRQYDPRRIIREALLDDTPVTPAVRPVTKPATRPEPAYLQHKAKSAGGPVPIGTGAEGAGGAVGAIGPTGVAGAAAGAAAAAAAASGAGTEGDPVAGDPAFPGETSGEHAPAPAPAVASGYDSEAT